MTPRTRRGFTLVELAVVFAIIGVAISIVGPAFITPDALRGHAAAAPLARLLERAQRTAITTGRVTTVIVDPVSQRAWVRTAGPPPTIDTSFVLALPSDTHLSSTVERPRITFDPRGGATGDLLVVTSAGARSVLRVTSWSGDVRVSTASLDPTGQ